MNASPLIPALSCPSLLVSFVPKLMPFDKSGKQGS
jgi:hypothetical protein